MREVEIKQLLAPPLFCNGLYYVRAVCLDDWGFKTTENIMFRSEAAARAASVGDKVIL